MNPDSIRIHVNAPKATNMNSYITQLAESH